MQIRVCRKCGEEKPETTEFFNRHSTHPAGLNTRCKACIADATRERKARDPERAKQAQKAALARYKARHPERYAQQRRDALRKFHGRRPEYAREESAKRRQKDPEKCAAFIRRWQTNNPERFAK